MLPISIQPWLDDCYYLTIGLSTDEHQDADRLVLCRFKAASRRRFIDWKVYVDTGCIVTSHNPV